MGDRRYPQATEYEGIRIASASSIEINFYYQGDRCYERVKGQPTPANIKRLAAHRGAIIDAIDQGSFDYQATFPDSKNAPKYTPIVEVSPTIQWYLEEVYKPRAETYLKASSLEDYAKTIKNELVPAFGHIPLNEFHKSHAMEWVGKKTCGIKRLINILVPLRVALSEAVDEGYIDADPLRDWKPKRRNHAPKTSDVDPFTRKEQIAILRALPEGQVRNLFRLAFWTGLRTSELIALSWSDVDLSEGELHISKSMTTAASEPEDTKTIAGRRVIKILPDANAALIAQKAHTFLAHNEVFQHPIRLATWTGDKPIRESYWRPALKKAKVRYRRPYQTRHTYASMLLSAGENIGWVADQMGHGDLNMVARIYGKWIPEADPEAGLKAAQIFGIRGVDLGVDFKATP